MIKHFNHDITGTAGLLVTYKVDNNKITLSHKIVNMQSREEKQSERSYMYELLECRTLDVVCTPKYEIWLDDEGLMVSRNPVIEFFIKGNKYMLAGRLLFSKGTDDEGNVTWFSLTSEEDIKTINEIKRNLDISRLGKTD